MYVCTCEYVYLNICTYMSPQLKFMYTETPDFGKNKLERTPKITKKYREMHSPTSKSQFHRFARFFLAGVTEKNDSFCINLSQVFFFLSFFLSWVLKTQSNHWTNRMAYTQLAT